MKKFITLLLALAMLLSMAACGQGTASEAASTPASAAAPAEAPDAAPAPEQAADAEEAPAEAEPAAPPKETVTLGWTYSPEDFEPAFSNNSIGLDNVYESLFIINPDTGSVECMLAESYEWEDDVTLKISLNPNAKFNNGDPVTPEDVLWSMQYYIEAGSNLSTYYTNYDFENCEIIDDTTFILKYFEPYGPAINYLTLAKIQNKSYYEEFGEEAYWDKPCGSGPYEVAENVSGSHTTYRLREDYWNPDMMPDVKEVIVKSYPEVSTMYIDFENGALDIAWNIDTADAERAQASGYNVTIQSDLDVKMFNLASFKEEFQDPLVREAIACAVEWDLVGETAFGILCSPATSTLPTGCDYKIDTEPYTYDPERAKELLKQAGYEDGFDIHFVLVSDVKNTRMAEAIQAYLADVGINFTFDSYDIPTAIPMFMTGQTDGIIKTAQGGAFCLEPDQIYDTMKASSTNISCAVQDEEFDGYLMDGLYSVDTDVRKECYENAQTWIRENYWAIPICESAAAYVCADGVSLNAANMLAPMIRFIHVG